MYNKLLEILHVNVARFLAFLMATMLINVTWQVVSRKVFDDPSSFTEELALYLMVWIGILGASYAFRTRAHLGLDVLTASLPAHKKAITEIISMLFCIGFATTVMIFGGSNLVALTLSLNQMSPALEIKVGYVYSVIPLSGLLITLYAVHILAQALQTLRHAQAQA